MTIVAGSLTGMPYAHEGFGLTLDFVTHAMYPHHFAEKIENEIKEMFVDRLVNDLEEHIKREDPATIGGFIAEPVMGAGGVIIPPDDYYVGVQEILKKHHILFIVDEVICGFGRTGNYWGSETFNLKPDILTCAKALSAAYSPIAAVLMSKSIVRAIENQADNFGVFGHGFTYSANPLSSAIALRASRSMRREK